MTYRVYRIYLKKIGSSKLKAASKVNVFCRLNILIFYGSNDLCAQRETFNTYIENTLYRFPSFVNFTS